MDELLGIYICDAGVSAASEIQNRTLSGIASRSTCCLEDFGVIPRPCTTNQCFTLLVNHEIQWIISMRACSSLGVVDDPEFLKRNFTHSREKVTIGTNHSMEGNDWNSGFPCIHPCVLIVASFLSYRPFQIKWKGMIAQQKNLSPKSFHIIPPIITMRISLPKERSSWGNSRPRSPPHRRTSSRARLRPH